jgi:hypothetical protein
VVSQVIAMMCDAVSDTGSWDLLGATIVSFCIRSSVVAMGLSAADANSMVYQSIMEADFPGESPSRLLPLSNSSSVLASLLVDMLERRRTIPTSQKGAADLDALVQNLTWDLSKLVLKMFTHAQEYRSCATRILLQPVLISLADVSCVTTSFGAVQHKLSRCLKSICLATMRDQLLIQIAPTQVISRLQVWFPRMYMEFLYFSISFGAW